MSMDPQEPPRAKETASVSSWCSGALACPACWRASWLQQESFRMNQGSRGGLGWQVWGKMPTWSGTLWCVNA